MFGASFEESFGDAGRLYNTGNNLQPNCFAFLETLEDFKIWHKLTVLCLRSIGGYVTSMVVCPVAADILC